MRIKQTKQDEYTLVLTIQDSLELKKICGWSLDSQAKTLKKIIENGLYETEERWPCERD